MIPGLCSPALGPNPGAGNVPEQESWGVHFIRLLHQPWAGERKRGGAAISACPCVHTVSREQTSRGSADVWVGSLSLPGIRVVSLCLSGTDVCGSRCVRCTFFSGAHFGKNAL